MSLSEAKNINCRLKSLAQRLGGPDTAKSVKKVSLLYTSWYPEVVHELLKSARQYLVSEAQIPSGVVVERQVPGSFELPLYAQREFESGADFCVVLGCVVQGETPHFEFICSALSEGTMMVQLKYNRPIGFGVLTVANLEQALARKDKGHEAAEAAWISFLSACPTCPTSPLLETH